MSNFTVQGTGTEGEEESSATTLYLAEHDVLTNDKARALQFGSQSDADVAQAGSASIRSHPFIFHSAQEVEAEMHEKVGLDHQHDQGYDEDEEGEGESGIGQVEPDTKEEPVATEPVTENTDEKVAPSSEDETDAKPGPDGSPEGAEDQGGDTGTAAVDSGEGESKAVA